MSLDFRTILLFCPCFQARRNYSEFEFSVHLDSSGLPPIFFQAVYHECFLCRLGITSNLYAVLNNKN